MVDIFLLSFYLLATSTFCVAIVCSECCIKYIKKKVNLIIILPGGVILTRIYFYFKVFLSFNFLCHNTLIITKDFSISSKNKTYQT